MSSKFEEVSKYGRHTPAMALLVVSGWTSVIHTDIVEVDLALIWK